MDRVILCQNIFGHRDGEKATVINNDSERPALWHSDHGTRHFEVIFDTATYESNSLPYYMFDKVL